MWISRETDVSLLLFTTHQLERKNKSMSKINGRLITRSSEIIGIKKKKAGGGGGGGGGADKERQGVREWGVVH